MEIKMKIQRASDHPLAVLRRRNRKEKDMSENVKEIEGQELDMNVEPTTEEIAAAEKLAEEEAEG